ncbi:MAG: enoyl-CoA hydratase-related protein [Bacteroidota bacterium]|nr:enoyl-CoA hydratase-related protein [Bacteroidota bacterium]
METLQLIISDQTAIVTFSRPQSLNALNSRVFQDLNRVLDDLETNNNIRVIILTGEGKAFVAGADIAEMKDKSPAEALLFSQVGHDTFNRIENCTIPVIAAVNGFALGGGLELALACDFIIASDKAKFSAPEVNLGLIPGFNGTQRLPRAVGTGFAKYMLFTAQMIEAPEAKQNQLVQLVVPAEELMAKTIEVAHLICQKGPQAISSVKKAVNFGQLNGYQEGGHFEMNEFSNQFTEQGKEGMTAFLEKRKPNWE